MGRLHAINLHAWVRDNRHLLKPPVGNKLLYCGEFKVMLVGGPNSRTDYHIESGEEWFYQLEGEMVLKVVDDGNFYDVTLKAGETFCLPAGIPHSPQRRPNSVGLVLERERKPGEMDVLQWYCQIPSCRSTLFRREFFCGNLEKDITPVITEYYSSEENRTCRICGFVEPLPKKKTVEV